MVHRPFRLAEIISLMVQYRMEPKTDASGVSLRGPGAEYGADRGIAGWKKPNDRGKTINCIQRAWKIYG